MLYYRLYCKPKACILLDLFTSTIRRSAEILQTFKYSWQVITEQYSGKLTLPQSQYSYYSKSIKSWTFVHGSNSREVFTCLLNNNMGRYKTKTMDAHDHVLSNLMHVFFVFFPALLMFYCRDTTWVCSASSMWWDTLWAVGWAAIIAGPHSHQHELWSASTQHNHANKLTKFLSNPFYHQSNKVFMNFWC